MKPAKPNLDAQLRELARKINKPALNFDPLTHRKAVITAVDLGTSSTPPTVTVNMSGDTTVAVPAVRFETDFSPQVGDTAIVTKQGSELFISGAIPEVSSVVANSLAGGWIKPTLGSGKSHGGNSNGDLRYRRVMQDGCWKMQWRGAFSGIGGSGNTVLSAALATEYRPSQRLSIHATRDADGTVSVGVDFNTDGTVTLFGRNLSFGSGSTGSAGSHSHGGPAHFHSHGGAVSATSFSESTDSVSSHTHTLSGSSSADPAWVSFNGIEYFL